jgi:outer membrane protein TolC
MRITLFISLLLIGSPCLGQAAGVDLRQALREAVAARPFVEASRQEAQSARSAADAARSRYFPRVTLSETFSATDEPAGSLFATLNQERLILYPSAAPYNDPPTTRDFETRLTLEQPLFDPDISFSARRADRGAEAAEAGARWSAEEAAFSAFQAYLAVQSAGSARQWVESSLKEARETERLASLRQEAGLGLLADTLRARVALAEAERRALSSGNDLTLARKRLALALGRSGGEADIAAPLSAEEFAAVPAVAGGERADLSALTHQAEAADLAYRQSRAAFLPRAGLSAAYALHDEETPFGAEGSAWSVRAGLTWEIFDGLGKSHLKQSAAAARNAAVARRTEISRQAEFHLEEARLRAEEARLQLASARQALESAEESRRLLLDRYDAGLSNLSDLLALQAALDGARFEAVNAESRLILALGNIRFQSGTFVESLLPAEENSP